MKRSYIALGVALLLTSMLEIALVWSLPHLLLAFHVSFIVVASVTFIGDWQKTIWYALLQGLILDIYSPQVFGLYICTAVLLTLAIAVLQATWLKQASLLSVATIAGASFLIGQLIVWVAQWSSEALHLTDVQLVAQSSWLTVLAGWLMMILCTAAIVRLISPRYEKLL